MNPAKSAIPLTWARLQGGKYPSADCKLHFSIVREKSVSSLRYLVLGSSSRLRHSTNIIYKSYNSVLHNGISTIQRTIFIGSSPTKLWLLLALSCFGNHSRERRRRSSRKDIDSNIYILPSF